MSGVRRVAYVVTGRVQGVAFRAHARDAARSLGVTGFVANRADGAVIGEAQAPTPRLGEFLAALHRGSPWSRVEHVAVDDLAVRDGEERFEVQR